jgi:hypothetical protein
MSSSLPSRQGNLSDAGRTKVLHCTHSSSGTQQGGTSPSIHLPCCGNPIQSLGIPTVPCVMASLPATLYSLNDWDCASPVPSTSLQPHRASILTGKGVKGWVDGAGMDR